MLIGTYGWARIAPANNVMLLLPQMKAGVEDGKTKCWDTDGYASGDLYATNVAGQISGIMKMVKRMLEQRDSKYNYLDEDNNID